jgi:hypothetical protein
MACHQVGIKVLFIPVCRDNGTFEHMAVLSVIGEALSITIDNAGHLAG